MSHQTARHHQKITSAYSALILATIIWAGALPIIKLIELYIPPFTLLLLRFIIVCIIVLPIMYVETSKTAIDKRDLKSLVVLGLLGQASLALIFWGIKYTTSIDSAIINTIAPLIIIFAGHHFFNEKVGTLTKIGIAIATLGTAVIVLEPVFLANTAVAQDYTMVQRLFGNLLVFAYNIAFATYTVYSKIIMGHSNVSAGSFLQKLNIGKMRKAYSPTLLTGFTFYVGLISMIPLAIIEKTGFFGYEGFSLQGITPTSIAGLLYMAILSSCVAYFAYEWGLKVAGVADSAIFGYLGPLFTIPFSFVLLNELPTQINILGGILIGIGVYVAESYKNYRGHKQETEMPNSFATARASATKEKIVFK